MYDIIVLFKAIEIVQTQTGVLNISVLVQIRIKFSPENPYDNDSLSDICTG